MERASRRGRRWAVSTTAKRRTGTSKAMAHHPTRRSMTRTTVEIVIVMATAVGKRKHFPEVEGRKNGEYGGVAGATPPFWNELQWLPQFREPLAILHREKTAAGLPAARLPA